MLHGPNITHLQDRYSHKLPFCTMFWTRDQHTAIPSVSCPLHFPTVLTYFPVQSWLTWLLPITVRRLWSLQPWFKTIDPAVPFVGFLTVINICPLTVGLIFDTAKLTKTKPVNKYVNINLSIKKTMNTEPSDTQMCKAIVLVFKD